MYGEALQYRFDVSAEMKMVEPEELSQAYLTDVLDGIEMPLEGIFAELRGAIAGNLIGDPDGRFGVTGILKEIVLVLSTSCTPAARLMSQW